MSKKKKKSAREKRVLVGALLVAAVITAGATFAWFTSKDEVTNRLTASADYNVSIVETFTPPAQWLPGAEINKDVYAVNTGNISAFVKESISGVLNYTYESLTATAPTSTAEGYIELSSTNIADTEVDGATTMEAGAFLAWTNTTEPLGAKISARASEADTAGERWVPSASGVYIFRRNVGGTPTAPTFTYAGYYYDATSGKYYKIVLGDDQYPATQNGQNWEFDVSATDRVLGAGVTINEDGTIEGTPNFSYVKEEKVTDENAVFTLDAANQRLVVTYKPGASGSGTSTYDATAAAARAEIDYLNAQGKNNIATKSYKLALADLEYASTLANASNALIEAAKAQKALIDDATDGTGNKKGVADTARGTVNTDAAAVTGFTDDSLIYSSIVNAQVVAYATDNANASSAVATNYNKMKTLWEQMYGDGTTTGLAGEITTALNALSGLAEEANAADEATQAGDAVTSAETVKAKLDELKALMAQYKEAYADLSASTATATSLTTTPDATAAAVKGSIQTFIDALPINKAGTLVTDAKAYKKAADAYNTAADAVTASETTWADAIAAYNNAITSADTAYMGVLTGLGTPFTAQGTYDHRGTLAGTYATSGADSYTANQVDATTTQSSTYSSKPNITLPTDSTLNVTAPDPDNNADLTGTITDATKTVAEWAEAVGRTFTAQKDAAMNKDATPITIYVNLAADYANNWEFDKSTDGTTASDFYLKKILAAGETSEQLVDSVELADTVTVGSYKEMTFDLNVILNSDQITYADDQVTITAEAVLADDNFKLTPTITEPTNPSSPLTWN